MGCHSLLQGIFMIQGSNLRLPHYRQILYHQATKKDNSKQGKDTLKMSPLNCLYLALRHTHYIALDVFFSVQFSSVAQSCPTLCDPMNGSTPGLPVHHQLPEFTQTQVHRVGDAIQPSHPQSSPSPPAANPSQHQSLFQ